MLTYDGLLGDLASGADFQEMLELMSDKKSKIKTTTIKC